MSSETVKKLRKEKWLTDAEFKELLSGDFDFELIREADSVRRENYGTDVFMRGLIEFSNYCKNNCYYCGIRCGNRDAVRYRLSKGEILDCAERGYELGFRTFVLQGGEDPFFDDDRLCDVVLALKTRFSDCAVTLSVGERSKDSYKRLFAAGADRYLLRHETADGEHYGKLHPRSMSLENRKRCLFDLKDAGYQVGTGIMVGSPFQTEDHIVKDLGFMKELSPDMIGIGPFIRHEKTPFATCESGSVDMTVRLISILRLMFPYALIPATTALGTLDPRGREKGLKAGANVVMPNLSPSDVREYYKLYDNKLCSGDEAAEAVKEMSRRIESAGYKSVVARGDVLPHRL